jgi:hypothetical protein
MSTILAKAGLAALMALGTVCAGASMASAGALSGTLSGTVHEVRYDPHGARICSPVLAVQKARSGGMRYARIANITARRVIVEGRNRHGPERIVFANLPGCPLFHRR